jgi:hypothetical protein
MTALTAAVTDEVRMTDRGDQRHDSEPARASVNRLQERRLRRSWVQDLVVLGVICATQLTWLASLGYGLYRLA